MTTSAELLAKCAMGFHPWVARVNDHGDHYDLCLACGTPTQASGRRIAA